VTAEEHQRNGGLGESIASVLSRHAPAPLEMIAVNDTFGESGNPTDLLEKYGLGINHILEAVNAVLHRKKTGLHPHKTSNGQKSVIGIQ
jgi:transketolase